MPVINAWLFDLYPSLHGLTVWLIDGDGRRHRCTTAYAPSFYMRIEEHLQARVAALTARFPFRISFGWESQRDIYANREYTVLRVVVHDTLRFREVVWLLERHFPHYVFFNSDIPVQQLFLYSTGLFPLARGEYEIDETGRLVGWEVDDLSSAVDYTLPPLSTLRLANKPDFVSPKHRRNYQLEVEYDGRTYGLEGEGAGDILHSLNRHLREADPDILLTAYGDAILLPMLTRMAEETGIPLLLNRDRASGYFTSNETSYVSYGKMVHKDGAFELAGRWHLDTMNSFMFGEASLDGVVEIARMTQLPVQRQSRTSIGTALSSMQLSWAVRNRYLIPARKREPEDFKSAATLLLADRGGLIYQPKIGYHEQVAELDFVSMYPTIMVEHNVSPETVNCRCCSNSAVPELGYTICENRIGIVPSTLRPVVAKRAFYKKEKKRLKKLGDPRWHLFDHRQNSLKWMLVTCFGYLGYKNARFGRIEAHESVNAYSRDAILRAKEVAENNGYEFIHAIVDCLWLKKEGATEEDYEALAAEISGETGIDLSLEGIYRWILFPASKMDPHLPTANRYVGYYSNGEIKIRGIEVRRRDTPLFIKRMQGEMLKIFEHAAGIAEVRRLFPAALEKAKEFLTILRSGRADPLELVIRRHISKGADEYTNRSTNAEAVKALDEAGITLQPGEMVEYVIVDATGKKKPRKAVPLALYSFDDGYDIDKYTEIAKKAAETLLGPVQWEEKEGARHPRRRKSKRITAQTVLPLYPDGDPPVLDS